MMIYENLKNITVTSLDELKLERDSFSCSVKALDDYFHHYASQDVKKGLAKCYVLIDNEQSKIIGYYTLSSLSIPLNEIPKERLKVSIPYNIIPAVLIGRLAIDDNFKKQGYGNFLLADAIHRINKNGVGSAFLIVEAKDDNAASFYTHFGFIEFTELDTEYRKLFYPLANIIELTKK